MAQITVRPGFNNVLLTDGNRYSAGTTVTLTDAQVAVLSPAQANQVSLSNTASNLNSANLVYPLGLQVIESDTNSFKNADGVTAYASLPYRYVPPTGGSATSPTDALNQARAYTDAKIVDNGDGTFTIN